MAKPKTNAEGWALVLQNITRADIARHIGQTRQAISKWDEVPYKYVLQVEAVSGVSRDLILPEMAALFKLSPQKDTA